MFFSSVKVLMLSAAVALTLMGATASSAVADEIQLDREVSISQGHDSFHAVSDSQGFRANDRFDIIFDEGTITMWYSGNTSSPEPRFWEFEISFKTLFSFVDDGDGRFGPGDNVVSTVDISDSAYSLTYSVASLPDGGNRTTVTAVSQDGMLTLAFIITSSPTLVDQLPISPTEVKLDIRISGLEFADGADHIGLSMSVDTDIESSVDLEEADGSGQLNLTQTGLGGFFQWSDNASVDGVLRAVGVTWGEDVLTFSYPAGSSIVHDPVLGVRSMAPLSGVLGPLEPVGNLVLFGIGLALASATVLGTVAVRRRKNH